MSVVARAAGRVLLRTIAKTAAYVMIAGTLLGLVAAAVDATFGSPPPWLALVILGLWASLALWVFVDKVRAEAQRLRGAS